MGGGGAPLTPAESVGALRQVIEGLTAKDKGLFLNTEAKRCLGKTKPSLPRKRESRFPPPLLQKRS
jgi:hypothetical protein